MSAAVHFVGPYADRYDLAVRLFGKPDFRHPVMDAHAESLIADEDTVIFVGRVVEQAVAA